MNEQTELGNVRDEVRKHVYSVSELNREIRGTLENRFLSVWIEGEISNFKWHSSGHMYMTLKDEKAQVSAVFFSRYNARLRFELKDGLKVLVKGRISVYEPRGQYQVYIEQVELRGAGALQRALEQLKEKLSREGLFDSEHKKAIPRFPQTVGVVTSPTGAAIRDIMNVIERRFGGTRILLFPVRVQGEGAAGEIEAAIRAMNEHGEADVLIVGRGGGSLEDLWAFNEERVLRAIHDSVIPVISAVGHEIDWTLSDLAADLRAPTPSAAAELVVESRDRLVSQVREASARMAEALKNRIIRQRQRVDALQGSYALRQPESLVEQQSQKLDEMIRQLVNYGRAGLNTRDRELAGAAGRLRALSPLSVLERGYSLTTDDSGAVVRSSRQLCPGQKIRTRFGKGSVVSQVLTLEHAEEK